MSGDKKTAVKLKKHFGFVRDLVTRAEHVFYQELVKRVPQLSTMIRVLDGTISSGLFGKQKCLEDPRPDYFHLDEEAGMALHGEFDETRNHEDNDERLQVIAHQAGVGVERVYVFRVQADIGGKYAVCEQARHGHVAFYKMTKHGYKVLDNVVAHVRQCLDSMAKGILPHDGNRKVIL